MKRISAGAFIALLGFMILLLMQATRGSADETQAPQPKASCVTASCHATMGKDKFVHAPVTSGDCDSCHTAVEIHSGREDENEKHKFAPIQDVSKLCYQCHEEQNKKKVVHPPVKDGNCTACHDPHQSPNKFQLKAAGSELCFLCHDKSMMAGKFQHGPAATGSCAVCHAAHQSDNGKLLVMPVNDLCFNCHSDKADAIKGAKFVHTPVRDSCTNCHSPHSADFRYNLPAASTRDLCFTCHSDKEAEIKEATVPHKALDLDRKCLTCHDPHASPYPRQLLKQPADLCLSCHNRTYGSGKTSVADIQAILNSNTDHHGPIRQNDCSACHNPHGSKNFRMLRQNFPQLFYAPYDPANYKLCFMCHENGIASEPRTTTLTNFRNGNINLHYLHVNQEKGRTCRACHDAHATNNPKHIRENVPFGKWQLPTGFIKTESGGSCQPGCHQRFAYDRLRPVVNKAPDAAVIWNSRR